MAQEPQMMQEKPHNKGNDADTSAKRIKVMAFIDGFNVYHSLDFFERGETAEDRIQFRKFRWLNLRKLLENFIDPGTDDLERVLYFTAYPNWNPEKKLRHETYVSALRTAKVEVIFGEFKNSMIQCKVPKPSGCQEFFQSHEEKQTDVNIAVSIIEFAEEYDKLLLLTADSDQVPTIKLLRRLHPNKHTCVIHPIARRSKELEGVCDSCARITASMLADAQFDDPIQIVRPSGMPVLLSKPNLWRI